MKNKDSKFSASNIMPSNSNTSKEERIKPVKYHAEKKRIDVVSAQCEDEATNLLIDAFVDDLIVEH